MASAECARLWRWTSLARTCSKPWLRTTGVFQDVLSSDPSLNWREFSPYSPPDLASPRPSLPPSTPWWRRTEERWSAQSPLPRWALDRMLLYIEALVEAIGKSFSYSHYAGAWCCQQEGGRGSPCWIPQIWREGSYFLRCRPLHCRWHGGKSITNVFKILFNCSKFSVIDTIRFWKGCIISWNLLKIFQVSIADKFVDMSMASKLTKYSDLIKGAA